MGCALGSSPFKGTVLSLIKPRLRSRSARRRGASTLSHGFVKCFAVALVNVMRPMDCLPMHPRSFRLVPCDEPENHCLSVNAAVIEVRLGDRLSWPIRFTSSARHGGARLEKISGKDLAADHLYVSTTRKFCSPPGTVSALFGEHTID